MEIVIDDVTYNVRFEGFEVPLEITLSDGTEASLMPWTYREHMEALRQNLLVNGKSIDIDESGFAGFVLQRSGIPEMYHEELSKLAIFWASAGNEQKNTTQNEDWFDFGNMKLKMSPWSTLEREQAISGNLESVGDGETFDVIGYLDAMIRQSIQDMEPVVDLNELDPLVMTSLFKSVLEMNAPTPLLPENVSAEKTLRLCSALGWTPTQVWNAPAVETDRLLALLESMQPETVAAPPTSTSSLANHPDAVVFHFEDDA